MFYLTSRVGVTKLFCPAEFDFFPSTGKVELCYGLFEWCLCVQLHDCMVKCIFMQMCDLKTGIDIFRNVLSPFFFKLYQYCKDYNM